MIAVPRGASRRTSRDPPIRRARYVIVCRPIPPPLARLVGQTHTIVPDAQEAFHVRAAEADLDSIRSSVGHGVAHGFLRDAKQVHRDLVAKPGKGALRLECAGDAKQLPDVQRQAVERCREIRLPAGQSGRDRATGRALHQWPRSGAWRSGRLPQTRRNQRSRRAFSKVSRSAPQYRPASGTTRRAVPAPVALSLDRRPR